MSKTFSHKGIAGGFSALFLFMSLFWVGFCVLSMLEGSLDILTGLFMLVVGPATLGIVFALISPFYFPKIIFSSDKLSYKGTSIFYREIEQINLITKETQGRVAGMGFQEVFLIVEGSSKKLTLNLTTYRMYIEEILRLLIQYSPNARISPETQEFLDLGLDHFVREKVEKPVKKNPFAWILLGATALPVILLIIGGFIKIIVTIFSRIM